MWYWYFGNIDQRLRLENWMTIFTRIKEEILGYTGVLLSLLGFLMYKNKFQYLWTISFLFGGIVYLLVFFNLNTIHNYYQIPFIAPLSILAAMGVQKIQLKWRV